MKQLRCRRRLRSFLPTSLRKKERLLLGRALGHPRHNQFRIRFRASRVRIGLDAELLKDPRQQLLELDR